MHIEQRPVGIEHTRFDRIQFRLLWPARSCIETSTFVLRRFSGRVDIVIYTQQAEDGPEAHISYEP
jgi:hypothetical protein